MSERWAECRGLSQDGLLHRGQRNGREIEREGARTAILKICYYGDGDDPVERERMVLGRKGGHPGSSALAQAGEMGSTRKRRVCSLRRAQAAHLVPRGTEHRYISS